MPNKEYSSIREWVWLNVLYELRIKNLHHKEIAEKYQIHINTVTNIKKKYAYLSNEEIQTYYEERNCEKIYRRKKSKVTEELLIEIEACCKEELNCYLDIEEMARTMCRKKAVNFIDVYNYNSENFHEKYKMLIESDNIEDYEFFCSMRKKIYSIRNLRKPPKNFSSVYWRNEEFRCISEKCFYLYAKEFWDDNAWKQTWQNKSLGEALDALKLTVNLIDEDNSVFIPFFDIT